MWDLRLRQPCTIGIVGATGSGELKARNNYVQINQSTFF